MLPMVSSVAQVDAAKRLIDQCYGEVTEEGASIRMPEVGVMIEVPAAVYQAEAILERVDFLSVGSNDLVQYMLAVDRNNPQVAGLFQEFHPAVLQALSQIARSTAYEQRHCCLRGNGRTPGSRAALNGHGLSNAVHEHDEPAAGQKSVIDDPS